MCRAQLVSAACGSRRNIVRLRGVGATDLTDLVSMRESMFVVQVSCGGGSSDAPTARVSPSTAPP